MKPHSSRQFKNVVWKNKFVKSYLIYKETALFDFSEMQTTPHGVPEVGLKSYQAFLFLIFLLYLRRKMELSEVRLSYSLSTKTNKITKIASKIKISYIVPSNTITD
jgi:hypothetical protein